MAWKHSSQSFVWIFPVGRGNAAFVRTGLNQGFIVDMAGGAFEDPASFIRKNFLPHLDEYKSSAIAQAILSHPHADHITQCAELRSGSDLYPSLLTCPSDKLEEDRINWKRIKNPASAEELVKEYRELFSGDKRHPPLQTIHYDSGRRIENLEYGIYWVRPPVCEKLHPSDDNKYGNATSIILYVRHGNHTILFPGDVTPEALDLILADRDGVEKRFTRFVQNAPETWHDATQDQPSLGDLLAQHGLSVLIAPHHGLESCYSEALYHAMRDKKPRLVVISERRHRHENDGQTDSRYTSGSGGSGLGVWLDGTKTHKAYLSTVNGHHILCVFSGDGQPRVYAHRNSDKLLGVLETL